VIHKTSGLVLNLSPVSETSRVVTWMTEDFGRITTLVKGSQRPKSAFLGQYDYFYTCELLFYSRPKTRLHLARECSPLKTRTPLRSDWRACAVASYLADLSARVSPADAPHEGMFRALDRWLDNLVDEGASVQFLLWCELQLAALLGLAPRLRTCLACSRPFASGQRGTRFALADGGILCPACARTDQRRSAPVAPDTLAILLAWQGARTCRTAITTRCSDRQMAQAQSLLGSFLQHHLDIPLKSRALALEVLHSSRNEGTIDHSTGGFIA